MNTVTIQTETEAVVLPGIGEDASAQEVIIHSIMNAVSLKAAQAKNDREDIQSLPSLIKKKDVFVQHRDDDRIVATASQLIELVKDSPEIVQETSYYGSDHARVYLLRVSLSDSYVARVSNIMLKDVPEEYFDRAYGKTGRDGVVIRNFRSRYPGKPGIRKMMCIDLPPVWTDGEINEKTQENYSKYHCVTVKILREDLRFLGWFPGLDTQTGLCAGLDDMFVSLGDRDPNNDPEKPTKKLTFKQLK